MILVTPSKLVPIATTKSEPTAIISAVIAVAVMCAVESILQPGYVWKSVVKITMFFGSVVLFYLLYKDEKIKEHFKIKNKKAFAVCVVIALLTIGVILGAYALIQDYVNPEQIKDSLLNKEKVSVDNFLYVALYISAVNSFLEEIFFRGVKGGQLLDFRAVKRASVHEGGAFAYHIRKT